MSSPRCVLGFSASPPSPSRSPPRIITPHERASGLLSIALRTSDLTTLLHCDDFARERESEDEESLASGPCAVEETRILSRSQKSSPIDVPSTW